MPVTQVQGRSSVFSHSMLNSRIADAIPSSTIAHRIHVWTTVLASIKRRLTFANVHPASKALPVRFVCKLVYQHLAWTAERALTLVLVYSTVRVQHRRVARSVNSEIRSVRNFHVRTTVSAWKHWTVTSAFVKKVSPVSTVLIEANRAFPIRAWTMEHAVVFWTVLDTNVRVESALLDFAVRHWPIGVHRIRVKTKAPVFRRRFHSSVSVHPHSLVWFVKQRLATVQRWTVASVFRSLIVRRRVLAFVPLVTPEINARQRSILARRWWTTRHIASVAHAIILVLV